MTKKQVDIGVRGCIADPKNNFEYLRRQVQSGNPRAPEQARNVFGPKALQKKIGCHSRSLIVQSPAYIEARDQLGFGRKANRTKGRRVGTAIADEELAKGYRDSDPEWMAGEGLLARLDRIEPSHAEPLRKELLNRSKTPAQVSKILDVIEQEHPKSSGNPG